MVLVNTAETYRIQGKFAAAEPMYKRTISILEKGGPACQPALKVALAGYADLLNKKGLKAEASKLEERASKFK